MPALKKDNLKKNKYVDLEQIKRHLQVIEENKEYFSVDKEYINILAKHLDAGNSLETWLPPLIMKTLKGTRLIIVPNGNNVKKLDNLQDTL